MQGWKIQDMKMSYFPFSLFPVLLNCATFSCLVFSTPCASFLRIFMSRIFSAPNAAPSFDSGLYYTHTQTYKRPRLCQVRTRVCAYQTVSIYALLDRSGHAAHVTTPDVVFHNRQTQQLSHGVSEVSTK